MCTLGTHTVSFVANDKRNAEVRRCFESLDVGGLMSNPLHARGTAEEEARKENKPGTYRQSFRPFMWVWAPDEERAVWQCAFRQSFLLAQTLYGFSGNMDDLFGAGCADHKESTKSVFKANFPRSSFMQCYTHIWRNVVKRKNRYPGSTKEKKAQSDWFHNEVTKLNLNPIQIDFPVAGPPALDPGVPYGA